MKNLIIEFNGYDTALNVVANSKNKQAIMLSKDFLQFQEKSEKLTGDNDNPFNPDVHDYIETEEKYLSEVTKLIIQTTLFKDVLSNKFFTINIHKEYIANDKDVCYYTTGTSSTAFREKFLIEAINTGVSKHGIMDISAKVY